MVQREKIVDKLKGFVLQWKHETDTFQEVSYTFDVLLPEVGGVGGGKGWCRDSEHVSGESACARLC